MLLLRLSALPPTVTTRALATMASNNKVGVVLSGCGVYDGTEVHEAAACLAALTRQGLEPVIFAPDMAQAHVVDHSNGQEVQEKRNVMVESARIARGAVLPLSAAKAKELKAIVFPGGFGAAKNLCDFGFKGADMTVNAEVSRVLREFHAAGKPIALACIAPILAAKVLGKEGVQLTLGRKGDAKAWPFGDALDAARSFGATVIEKDVEGVCVDDKNRVITTPAFMYAGKFHEVQDGINSMIVALALMIKKVNP